MEQQQIRQKPTWAQLREWDKIEEENIKRFDRIRAKDSVMERAWDKFKANPIPLICKQ